MALLWCKPNTQKWRQFSKREQIVRVHQSQPKQKLSCISEHRTISKRISHAHDAVLLQRYNSNDKEMYQTTIFSNFPKCTPNWRTQCWDESATHQTFHTRAGYHCTANLAHKSWENLSNVNILSFLIIHKRKNNNLVFWSTKLFKTLFRTHIALLSFNLNTVTPRNGEE